MNKLKVLVEKRGAVTTITINRPEVRNAIDRETADLLAEVFREFEEDEGARVAVLTGADGQFSAGADLKSIASGGQLRFSETGDSPLGPVRMRLRKPVIAAVAGYAVAGGMALALWCDMRVVERTATFGMFDRRYGVPMLGAVTVNLPRLIGLSRAMDLILTGRPIPAKEAALMGLANRVVPAGEALAASIQLAEEIAAHPQICMRGDRRSAIEQWGMSEGEAMRNELRIGVETIESGETVSGAQRFRDGAGRHGAFSDDD